MTAPGPLASSYVRARRAVPVLVCRPCDSEDIPPLRFSGRLLGAMYARGELHHYRVEDGEGQLYLCPPHWIAGPVPVLVPAADVALAEAVA